jgi:hypothetical protein
VRVLRHPFNVRFDTPHHHQTAPAWNPVADPSFDSHASGEDSRRRQTTQRPVSSPLSERGARALQAAVERSWRRPMRRTGKVEIREARAQGAAGGAVQTAFYQDPAERRDLLRAAEWRCLAVPGRVRRVHLPRRTRATVSRQVILSIPIVQWGGDFVPPRRTRKEQPEGLVDLPRPARTGRWRVGARHAGRGGVSCLTRSMVADPNLGCHQWNRSSPRYVRWPRGRRLAGRLHSPATGV